MHVEVEKQKIKLLNANKKKSILIKFVTNHDIDDTVIKHIKKSNDEQLIKKNLFLFNNKHFILNDAIIVINDNDDEKFFIKCYKDFYKKFFLFIFDKDETDFWYLLNEYNKEKKNEIDLILKTYSLVVWLKEIGVLKIKNLNMKNIIMKQLDDFKDLKNIKNVCIFLEFITQHISELIEIEKKINEMINIDDFDIYKISNLFDKENIFEKDKIFNIKEAENFNFILEYIYLCYNKSNNYFNFKKYWFHEFKNDFEKNLLNMKETIKKIEFHIYIKKIFVDIKEIVIKHFVNVDYENYLKKFIIKKIFLNIIEDKNVNFSISEINLNKTVMEQINYNYKFDDFISFLNVFSELNEKYFTSIKNHLDPNYYNLIFKKDIL